MKKVIKSKFFIVGIVLIICVSVLIIIYFNSNIKIKTSKEEIDKNFKKVAVDISEKQIYGTYKTESNWVKDPSESNNLLEMGTNTSVVKIKINSVGESLFLQSTAPSPYTPIEVEIKEVLKGDNITGSKIIYVMGGKVKISDVMLTMNDAEIEKMEFNILTKEEQDNMYISYMTDYDYDLEVNQEYVVILTNDNVSKVMANGYGIFKDTNVSDGISTYNIKTLKNVLTGKTLNY